MIYYHRVQAVFEYLLKTPLEKFSFSNYDFSLIRKEFDSHKQIDGFVYSVIDHAKKVYVQLNIYPSGVIFGHINTDYESLNEEELEEKSEYLPENKAVKYIDLLIDHFDKQEEFAQAITVREMSSIPPGTNPYHYDSIRMGCNISQNWQAMFYTAQSSEEDPKPSLSELVLINTKTGRRFHLDLTKADEPVVIQKEKNVEQQTNSVY